MAKSRYSPRDKGIVGGEKAVSSRLSSTNSRRLNSSDKNHWEHLNRIRNYEQVLNTERRYVGFARKKMNSK